MMTAVMKWAVMKWALWTAMVVLAIAGGCGTKVTNTGASATTTGSGGSAGAGGMGGSAPVCPSNAKVCAGTCTDIANDPSNCGDCGKACPMGEVCSQGQCAVSCGAGTKLCNGACADVSFDPSNCGDCGKACPMGQPLCSQGQCALTCLGGATLCNGKCADTMVDPSNCGGCGKSCPLGQVCSQAACACGAGTKSCGGACVDVALDPNNCGDCGNSCGNGFCHDGQCNCGQSQALAGKSCADIHARCPTVQSGALWIRPDAAPVSVHCEMSLSGGGFTQLLQCLPADACTSGNTVVYNTDWTIADFGATSDNASFLLGKSLATVVNGSTMFMVVVTDTNQNKSARVLYPLNSDTRNFFSTAQAYYFTAPQQANIIDFDNTQTARLLSLCWAPLNSPFARSYQGAGGVSFLGNSTAAPSATPNGGCDFGPWAAQMLLRNPAVSSLSASWGIGPSGSWQAQPYAHRLYVK